MIDAPILRSGSVETILVGKWVYVSLIKQFHSLTLLIFAISVWALPNTDGAYFKLHQATGFFEQFTAGHCSIGKQKARALLIDLETVNSNPDLAGKSAQLMKMIGAEKIPTVAEIESFRLSIHEIQENMHLNHKSNWHEAVVSECI